MLLGIPSSSLFLPLSLFHMQYAMKLVQETGVWCLMTNATIFNYLKDF